MHINCLRFTLFVSFLLLRENFTYTHLITSIRLVTLQLTKTECFQDFSTKLPVRRQEHRDAKYIFQ